MRVKKIISGCQTGADSAGLEAGLYLGLETGGTVPLGRVWEDGVIPQSVMDQYHLVESRYEGYVSRTKQNIRDADGTVIFGDTRSSGSRVTLRWCDRYNKPYLVNPNAHTVRGWSEQWGIGVLNVAGNRESVNPGIFLMVFDVLRDALSSDGCGCVDCLVALSEVKGE